VTVGSVAGDLLMEQVRGGVKAESVAGDTWGSDVSGAWHVGDIGGDCRLERLNGALYLRRAGGDLALESCGASVEVDAVGGDVRVSGTESGSDLSLKHVSGDVHLHDVCARALLVAADGDIAFRGDIERGGTCNLTSTDGSIRLALPEDAEPFLDQVEAGGEVTCTAGPAAEETPDTPVVNLRAAGDIHIASHGRSRRNRRRPRRKRRHVRIPIPDVDGIISDVVEPLFGERRRRRPDLREERLMVLRMIEGGKVSAEEGARLLEALGDR